MTSRERMIEVLEHRLPDRVPLAEMWIDPNIGRAILPEARDGNEVANHLGMDVVTVLTMVYDEETVQWEDREKRIFRDKWGALQRLGNDAIPVPTTPAKIETVEDLARYTPPEPARSPLIEKVGKLREEYPDRAVAVVGESGWAPAVFLRGGLEHLLMDFGLRPGFARDLMRIGTDYYSELFRLVISAGADIVFLGDDYSDKNGPLVSPEQWDEIVLPCDTSVVSAIKKAGGYCIKHTDGNIQKIIENLVGTGLDCLGPLEDVPGMELDRILERFKGRLAVMGNLSVDLLSRGTEAEVVAATRRLLQTVSAVGPHIMSSGNTIASSVKPENLLAMVNATKEYGVYPISRVEY